MLIHSASTIWQHFIRMLIAIALTFGFQIWIQDVVQAYIKSREVLMHDVYDKPPEYNQLGPDHPLKLLKSLYGLSDARDY